MFIELINLIKSLESTSKQVDIEDISQFGEEKLEITLSSKHYMLSMSILKDLTYDLLVVMIKNEKIIKNKTIKFEDFQLLIEHIKEDYKYLSTIK